MNTVINTNSGPIRGQLRKTDTEREYVAFCNIPYVKPFVGDNVFKDPEPVEGWTEILDTIEEAPPSFNIDPFRAKELLCDGTLDSLGINVFCPNITPNKPLPVFIYIHGGAFINGSSSTALYGPDYLIERDVIMVSFNYRLNIFGFLSFNDPKVGIPGNAGLKDQNLALKWIKRNIHHFGGDPNNITLCGESAGSASVNYHMISPMSNGLFNRAIIMSGSVFAPWASIPDNYEEYINRLAKKVGLNGNETDEVIFRKICETPHEELLKHTLSIVEFNEQFFGPLLLAPFLPRVEPYDNGNSFLSKSLENLSENAWSNDIDLMIGGCSDEGIFYHLCDPSEDDLGRVNKDNSLLLPLELRRRFTAEENIAKGHLLKELYFGSETITKSKAVEYCSYIADKLTWYPKYRTIMHRQRSNNVRSTYLYRIDLPPSKDVPQYYDMIRFLCKIPHRKGTGHTEDLPLLFKNSMARRFKPGDDLYIPWQKFLHVYENYIKTGNPNHTSACPELDQWNAISKSDTDNLQCLEMNTSIWQMNPLVNLSKLQQWSTLYPIDFQSNGD